MPVTSAASPMDAYEIRSRKDKRGVDLISEALELFLIAGRQLIRPVGFRFQMPNNSAQFSPCSLLIASPSQRRK